MLLFRHEVVFYLHNKTNNKNSAEQKALRFNKLNSTNLKTKKKINMIEDNIITYRSTYLSKK